MWENKASSRCDSQSAGVRCILCFSNTFIVFIVSLALVTKTVVHTGKLKLLKTHEQNMKCIVVKEGKINDSLAMGTDNLR